MEQNEADCEHLITC